MRWLIVLGAACNQVYGLDRTQLPPPDAPYACTEIGAMMAPAFSRAVQQVSTQVLYSYHFTPDGTLVVGEGPGGIYVGGFEKPLEFVQDFVAPQFSYFRDPHPSPDGQRLYIRRFPDDELGGPGPDGMSIFERLPNGGWQQIETVASAIYLKGRPSTVFRGLTGDRMIFTGPTNLDEYERDSTGWNLRGAHPRIELGINDKTAMAVTADGLRAVFRGSTSMYYTDRPNLDSWFRTPLPIDGVPKVDDAQLTEDCARIYYSGVENTPLGLLDTVFFSQQQ